MHPKVEFKQVRNLNEVIDDSILFLKQNWKSLLKVYFTICGFFWAATLLTNVVSNIQYDQHQDEGGTLFSTAFFVSQAFSFLHLTLATLTILCFISLYKDKGNEPPTIEEVSAYVKFYFFRALGSTFLLSIGLAIGAVFCVIPAIYLFPIFSIIMPIMIIENTTFGYAFNRGFQLAKNNWGTIFGAIIIMSVIVSSAFIVITIPTMGITMGVVLIAGQSFAHTYKLVLACVGGIAQVFYILPLIAVTMTYFSFTEQLDGAGLMERIQLFGKAQTDNRQLPSEEY